MESLFVLLDELNDLHGKKEMSRVAEYIDILALKRPMPDVHPLQEANNEYFPGLTAKAWYEAEDFEWNAAMRAQSSEILRELTELAAQDTRFSPYEDPGSKDLGWPGWEIYPLYDPLGYTKGSARCPKTVAALKNAGHGPRQGMFSRVRPGAHIQPHSGPVNYFLTCHLALVVPPDCGIRVGDEMRHWREGEALVFDDSFVHEVWNHDQEERIVLIWDIWHPDLTVEEIAAIQKIQQVKRGQPRQIAQTA
ncbi:aspartyl/asparaginyl beta-hydroxylase domain-containing protein [Chromobacterium vaccinii]|uniref:aspartyl/asparaginyl beta-hydroxylase domain-containing protein n=1 Tax=Chromobacterium vaccinii TaxID=1108595 RepID=UPI000695D64D|nr:aspartyl/asparaginyl beta-hydroxylase domain-containing protein [Chromobacterium vaccinii]